MAISIKSESLIRFSQVPAWCKKHLGNRVHPSTVARWRIRGARGVKLESLLAGGIRYTSEEALQRFFCGSTAVQDGEIVATTTACPIAKVSHDSDAAFLESEGI